MNEFYYGTIGKDKSYRLLSDTPIVVYKKKEAGSEFISVDTIAEANALYTAKDDVVYFWENGGWQEVHFSVEGGKHHAALGFCPR